MADIARRNFGEIRDEVLKRHGKLGPSTPYKTRVEYNVWQAYLHLALTFYHHELTEVDTSKTVSTSVNTVALPVQTYAVLGVALWTSGGAFAASLNDSPLPALHLEYRGTSGTPDKCARVGDSLFFDKIPGTAWKLHLLRYKRPDYVDFSAADEPEISELFDEYIIKQALAFTWPAAWRFDLATVEKKTLVEVMAESPYYSMRQDPIIPPMPSAPGIHQGAR